MYKEKLPYSQSALILGVSSIITACCCWGIPGIVLGVIGLYNANKSMAIYDEDPGQFDGINNAQTGRTTSIIGIIFGLLVMIWLMYQLATGDFEMILEEYNNMIDDQI